MYNEESILTINGGSSSIKFSLFKFEEPFERLFYGEIESIGTQKAKLNFTDSVAKQQNSISLQSANHNEAANNLIDWLEKRAGFDSIKAIGHRIVHGMIRTEPEIITPELLGELKRISAYDPEHLPGEIALIEVFNQRYPSLKQVACFDTAFHASLPVVAKMLAIPRNYYNKGIHRYGFHGLSYAYLMQELKKLAGKEAVPDKIILAHLGSGASLAAVKNGKSIDTTMGFTPASGLPMSSRTGDLDPGVAWYLMEFEKLNPQQFSHLINHESGLLGISGTSSDMRELMEIKDTDSRAAEAIEQFCYQTKKFIGSYIAVLGGLTTLVFSGGIGEHLPEVRSKICDGLEFLGIELDKVKNMKNEGIISCSKSSVIVHVIKTNEELMIVQIVYNLLGLENKNITL